MEAILSARTITVWHHVHACPIFSVHLPVVVRNAQSTQNVTSAKAVFGRNVLILALKLVVKTQNVESLIMDQFVAADKVSKAIHL